MRKVTEKQQQQPFSLSQGKPTEVAGPAAQLPASAAAVPTSWAVW